MNTKTLSEQTVNENSLLEYKKEVLAEFKEFGCLVNWSNPEGEPVTDKIADFISKSLDTQLEKVREGMPKRMTDEERKGDTSERFAAQRYWNDYHDEMIKLLNS